MLLPDAIGLARNHKLMSWEWSRAAFIANNVLGPRSTSVGNRCCDPAFRSRQSRLGTDSLHPVEIEAAVEATKPLEPLVYRVAMTTWRREVQLPGQGSFKILFQELAMPAIAGLERHVNPVPGILVGHGFSIGEYKANVIHSRKKPRTPTIPRGLRGGAGTVAIRTLYQSDRRNALLHIQSVEAQAIEQSADAGSLRRFQCGAMQRRR